MSNPPNPRHTLVYAPAPYRKTERIVFLSGTCRLPSPTWLEYLTSFLPSNTSPPPPKFSNWRDDLTATLSHLPITVLNPHRPDWDNSWEPHIGFPPFKEQVEWELDGMEAADVIAVFFDSHTDAPITLLELGLFVRSASQKVVVGAAEGYARKGNVQVVCQRFGVTLVDSKEELAKAVLRKIEEVGPKGG